MGHRNVLADAAIAPYVLRPTADRATIRWGSAGVEPGIGFWPEEHPEDLRQVLGEGRGEGLYEVLLTDLQPGTRYCYRRVGDAETRSFRTAPADASGKLFSGDLRRSAEPSALSRSRRHHGGPATEPKRSGFGTMWARVMRKATGGSSA